MVKEFKLTKHHDMTFTTQTAQIKLVLRNYSQVFTWKVDPRWHHQTESALTDLMRIFCPLSTT